MSKQRLAESFSMVAKVVLCIIVCFIITVEWTNVFAHFVITPAIAHLDGGARGEFSMVRFIAMMAAYLVVLCATCWAGVHMSLGLVSQCTKTISRFVGRSEVVAK